MSKSISKNTLLFLIAVICIGSNLRAPIVAVGPVIPEITSFLHLSPTWAGLVTSIPLLCFAFGSVLMPYFSKLAGLEKALFYSIIALLLGIIIRSLGSTEFLFFGASVVGLAITVCNVLMPSFIKKYFPKKVGVITAVYLTAMNLTSSISVGLAMKMGEIANLGWKSSIGIWFIFSFIALFAWIPVLKFRSNSNSKPSSLGIKVQGMWRSKMAWNISIFMGTQSVVFYSLAAWFPTMLQEWGMSPIKAGWMLSYFQLGSVPMMFFGPIMADKIKKQAGLIWGTVILLIVGISLIIFYKTQFAVLAIVLIGIAVGLAFALSMMFLVLRTQNAEEASELSGMSQSIGYLITAIFPPLFGSIYQLTHSWTIPLSLLFLIALLQLITGLPSAKNKFVLEKKH